MCQIGQSEEAEWWLSRTPPAIDSEVRDAHPARQHSVSPTLSDIFRGMATADRSKQSSRSTLSDSDVSTEPSRVANSEEQPAKDPIHRINAPGSVQALAVDDDVLFAGTQGGNIVVWSLETYDLLATVPAHKESVLGLSLSEDKSLLLSTGADSIVNVWSTETLQRLYSLQSPFEIGDIFCVVHSAKIQTLFWGAQNSSIQWYKLSTDAAIKSPILTFSPGPRTHRFFDSLGPGGSTNVIHDEDGGINGLSNQGGRVLTIPNKNYLPYAHKSYIYSMLLVKGLFNHDRDEEVLITGGGDGTIKLWSIDALSSFGLTQTTKFKNPNSNVLSLCSRASFLYAGLSGGTAHIYNLASSQLVHKLQVGHGDVSQILMSRFSILCGTSQGWVKVDLFTVWKRCFADLLSAVQRPFHRNRVLACCKWKDPSNGTDNYIRP